MEGTYEGRQVKFFGVKTIPLPLHNAEIYLIRKSETGYFLYEFPLNYLNIQVKIPTTYIEKQLPSRGISGSIDLSGYVLVL